MEMHYGITDSKPWNWSRRQASRQMSFSTANYYSGEIEYAAAVAAAAFAINTLESTAGTRNRPIMGSRRDYRASEEYEESRRQGHGSKLAEKIIRQVPSMKRTRTFSGSKKYPEDIQGYRPEMDTQIPDFLPPQPPSPQMQYEVEKPRFQPPPPQQPPQTQYEVEKPRIQEAEADEWERDQLYRIRQRYEKLEMTIREWEDKKRKKAERKLRKTEGELGKRRAKALQSYQDDIERIREVADGARAQSKEKRRKEELKVREKADKLRTTGQLPRTCLCF